MSDLRDNHFLNAINFKRAVWMAPAAYFVHIIEEASFGFHQFVSDNLGAEMSLQRFIVVNSVIMAVYVVLASLYTLQPNKLTANLFLILVLSAQFANTFLHLLLTVWFKQFCAGLISGLVVYIPLSGILVYRAYQERYINIRSGALLVLMGFVFMGLFFFISMFGKRVFTGG